MTLIQVMRDRRERRQVMRIVSPLWEGIDISNSGTEGCNDLTTDYFGKVLKQKGIDAVRAIVTPKPEGKDLRHVTRERQYGHEVLVLRVGVLDPLYPRRILPKEEYFKEVYRPEEGTELTLILQQA